MMHRPTIERDWPEDFAHENGNYENTCVVCGRLFLGHKRRIVCKVCTHAPSSSSPEGMVLAAIDGSEQRVDNCHPLDEMALVFTYRNWRGETSVRRVVPQSVRYGTTEWHPEMQWLMRALDLDKNASREFAIKDMVFAASPATMTNNNRDWSSVNVSQAARPRGLPLRDNEP